MSRRVIEMNPTQLRKRQDDSPAGQIRAALGPLADVREPQDADEPILAPSVRAALFSWLMEIRSVDDLAAVGLRPRNTALLFGPPGCGKTTLAHHLAARLGIPLVIVGPEMIFGKYLGESEGNVAKLFDVLSALDIPCVLFMDEIESLGGRRDMNGGGGADNARTSTLGVMLRRIEEYAGYALGATNVPDMIDPALWRRFHLQIGIDLPGNEERFAILRRYLHPFDMEDADIDLLVDVTAGASPALLRGVAEGVKRTLILAPRHPQGLPSAPASFDRIVQAIQPPPEIAAPPLWVSKTALEKLSALHWPPPRVET